MDIVSFLGGIALGAAGAALYDVGLQSKMLGQSFDDDTDTEEDPASGGGSPGGAFSSAGGGGGGGSGPGGVFVGPPSGGGGTQGPMAPPIGPPAPSAPTPMQPIISVPPFVTPNEEFGESFFGVSAPPWFWPLNFAPSYPPQNQELVCKKQTTDQSEETLVCTPRYPVANVAYTYGPPGYWMSGRR